MLNERRGRAPRDRPAGRAVRAVPAKRSAAPVQAAIVDNNGNTVRSLVWLTDAAGYDSLECAGYTSLSKNPEVLTAVDTIARLIGSMTIHLMMNTPRGDVRIINDVSRTVDISPSPWMTRSNLVRWIVRTMLLEGNGNAVVWPVTQGGRLRELQPIPAAFVSFIPEGLTGGYRVVIDGKEFAPDSLLHFVANPGELWPWKGEGYRIALTDVANNLKQATATEKGFMSSKWKPSIIVKVDALSEEFSGKAGRKKLLSEYVEGSEAGEPWLIPAEQFSVEQVKPLTLSDLALADFVKIDKETVAAVLGVPAFVLGVGTFNREAWNSFISTTIMPIALNIQQELTRKLLDAPNLFFSFNPRSLMNYSMGELISAGAQMVDRMAMRRNEWRDWMGLPPDEGMDDLLALENYIPADRLGDQKKLNDGGSDE